MADQNLTAVERAADELQAATLRLRDEVTTAHAAGASPTDLAHAARVTRQTIYRWVAEGSSH